MAKVLAVWGAVGLLTLTACGGEESSRTLDLDGGSSEAVAPEATKESTKEAPDEPRDGELTRGTNVASTPKEKAVAEAWFTYWEELVRVLGEPDPVGVRLRGLARGQALHGPLRYAKELAEGDLRLGGGAIATLSKVDIADGKAVVRGCIRTSMLEVDAANNPVEKLDHPWLATEHTLQSDGVEWFVVEYKLEGVPKCV